MPGRSGNGPYNETIFILCGIDHWLMVLDSEFTLPCTLYCFVLLVTRNS